MDATETPIEYTAQDLLGAATTPVRRGPGRPRKPLQAFTEDEDSYEDALEDKVHQLIEEFGPTGEIVAKICRKNGNNFEMVGQVEDIGVDNPLEQDSIGKMYGGGRYRIYFHVNGKMVRTVRFSLGREYDRYLSPQQVEQKIMSESQPRLTELVTTLREMQNMVKSPPAPPEPPKPVEWDKIAAVAVPAIGAVASLLQAIVQPIAEAIKESGRNRGGSDFEKFIPLLLEQTKSKNENAMVAFKEGLALARESLNPPSTKEPVEWQDIVMEMVKQAPMVLNPLFQTVGMRGLLKAYPQAQTVIDNPEALHAFKQQLIAEHGEEQANKILSVTGLDKGVNVPAPASMIKL